MSPFLHNDTVFRQLSNIWAETAKGPCCMPVLLSSKASVALALSPLTLGYRYMRLITKHIRNKKAGLSKGICTTYMSRRSGSQAGSTSSINRWNATRERHSQ
jgi:hypothetical protein